MGLCLSEFKRIGLCLKINLQKMFNVQIILTNQVNRPISWGEFI